MLELNQPAILPLTLLTNGGANRTIVAGVFNELQAHGLRNLLPVTNLLASLAFQNNQSNFEWLERKYREMTIDFRDLPAYHWMTDDAREEGLVQGREEGREEGLEAGLRLAAVTIIEKSFPEISKRAQKQLDLIHHAGPLTKLITRIHRAQTSDEAKRYLLEALGESLELD